MKPVRNLETVSGGFPAGVPARFDVKRGRGKRRWADRHRA